IESISASQPGRLSVQMVAGGRRVAGRRIYRTRGRFGIWNGWPDTGPQSWAIACAGHGAAKVKKLAGSCWSTKRGRPSHSDTFASRSFPHSVRTFSLLPVKANSHHESAFDLALRFACEIFRKSGRVWAEAQSHPDAK